MHRFRTRTRFPIGAVCAIAVCVLVVSASLVLASVEVRLKLPQKSRIDLAGRETITIAPS